MSGVSATLDPSPGRLPDPERSVVSRAPALRRLVRGVRRRHVAQSIVSAVVRWGLLLGLPWVLVAWWLPWYRSTVTTACLAALAGVAVYAAVRTLWQSRRALVTLERASLRDAAAADGAPASASPEATLVADELRTWAELDADLRSVTVSQRGMLHWLERDLHDRLGPEVRRALAQSTRPTLGRWRWLLPVLLMLLLAWLLATLLAPWWDGALGGRADQPRSGGGSGPSQASAGVAASDGSEGNGNGQSDGPPEQEQPADDKPDDQPGDEPPPDAAQPDPAADGDETTPPEVPPLLEVDDDRHFVLPDFVGDGPTRRARMHIAEIERARFSGGSSAAPSAQQAAKSPSGAQAGGEAGGNASKPPPPPAMPDFERAAERAVRSRHVPEAERDIVRRFFDRLRQRANQAAAPVGSPPQEAPKKLSPESAPEQKTERKPSAKPSAKTGKTGGER